MSGTSKFKRSNKSKLRICHCVAVHLQERGVTKSMVHKEDCPSIIEIPSKQKVAFFFSGKSKKALQWIIEYLTHTNEREWNHDKLIHMYCITFSFYNITYRFHMTAYVISFLTWQQHDMYIVINFTWQYSILFMITWYNGNSASMLNDKL